MSYRPNDYDVIVTEISRKECEVLDLSHLEEIVKMVEEKGKDGFKSLILAFDGWETVPSDLYEIPVVRDFIKKMVLQYPHIFYLLTDMQNLDMLYFVALGDLSTFMKTNGQAQPLKAVYDVVVSEDIYNHIVTGTLLYGEKIGDIENAQKTIQRIDDVLRK